jgi:hypothetical protein
MVLDGSTSTCVSLQYLGLYKGNVSKHLRRCLSSRRAPASTFASNQVFVSPREDHMCLQGTSNSKQERLEETT